MTRWVLGTPADRATPAAEALVAALDAVAGSDHGGPVWLATSPDDDPSRAPADAWRLAWVTDRVEDWADAAPLAGYDQVLAASPAALRAVLPVDDPRHGSVLPLAASADPGADGPDGPDGPVAVVDVELGLRGHGILPPAFWDAAASGALPLVRGALGVRALGLDLPTYDDEAEVEARVEALAGDPATARRARELAAAVAAGHTWDHRARTVAEAVDEARAAGVGGRRHAVHVWPDYRADNAYQRMLLAGLGTQDAFVVPVQDVVAHLEERAAATGDPGLLNLHWTGPVLAGCHGAYSVRQRLDAFTGALDAFRAAGGRLLWTVHNVLPHELRFPWAEVELARHLASSADLVHVLSEHTLVATRPHYALDEARVRLVEHSSYLGHQPDWISPEAARERLGLLPEEKVLVCFGTVRPYKGVEQLLDAFDELSAEDPTLRLVIAGRPFDGPATDALAERCARHPRVLAHLERIPDDRVQVYLRAADLAVLPYRTVLNSGAFLLALTFDLPVVGPARGALLAEDGQPHVRLFDPADPASLRATVRGALDDLVVLDPDGARASAHAAAVARSPEAMAAAFAAAVAPVLGPSAGAGAPVT